MARLPGLWILAGATVKALVATPGDLPKIVREIPLSMGTVFSLVVAIEALVGVLALVRPGRAWPVAGLLLLAYAVVAATQMAAGEHSCGCFGEKIPVRPWAMLAIDAGFVALLLASKPWRLAKGGRADAITLLVAMVAAFGMALVGERTIVGKPYVELDVESWIGTPIRKTPLAKEVDLSDARDGVWIIWRDSCEVCKDCLEEYMRITPGSIELTLVRLPPDGKPGQVHVLPTGPFVHRIDLPDPPDWWLKGATPARFVVENGIVTAAKTSIEWQECR